MAGKERGWTTISGHQNVLGAIADRLFEWKARSGPVAAARLQLPAELGACSAFLSGHRLREKHERNRQGPQKQTHQYPKPTVCRSRFRHQVADQSGQQRCEYQPGHCSSTPERPDERRLGTASSRSPAVVAESLVSMRGWPPSSTIRGPVIEKTACKASRWNPMRQGLLAGLAWPYAPRCRAMRLGVSLP